MRAMRRCELDAPFAGCRHGAGRQIVRAGRSCVRGTDGGAGTGTRAASLRPALGKVASWNWRLVQACRHFREIVVLSRFWLTNDSLCANGGPGEEGARGGAAGALDTPGFLYMRTGGQCQV
jgi:hypothetical protein